MSSFQQDVVVDERYLECFKGVPVYGIAGTNASGKDSLMEMLADEGFYVFNTSNALRQIAYAAFKSTARGGNETPMGRAGNAYRVAYPGGMVELGLLDWWLRADVLPPELKPRGLVIGSIRGTGEVERLKQVGGKLVVVDADPYIRFERLKGRGRADDPKTFEEFQAHEAGDMAYGETDPTKFGMAAVIDQADIRIENDSNNFKLLRDKAFEALGLEA